MAAETLDLFLTVPPGLGSHCPGVTPLARLHHLLPLDAPRPIDLRVNWHASGGVFLASPPRAARESPGHHRRSGRQNQGHPTYHGFARTDDAGRCVSVGKSMMSPPPKHARNQFSYPFLSSWRNPPLCRCGKNYRQRTLKKLSLCEDMPIVMFAFVFLVCSEKSKDQCVCLRLSEVRLIHHLNIEEPPSTP